MADFVLICSMTNKNPWTFLSSEQKYDNPWIKVDEHQVLKPSGRPGIYGVVHFKNKAIGIVAIDRHDYIYLVGQYRYPLKRYSWEIPEGGGPPGEEPLEAAKRELLEETGLIAGHWELMLEMDLSNSVSDESCLVFVATDLSQGQARPEDTEELQIRRLPFKDAVDLVLKGEITDSVSVAALLKLKILRERN